MKNPCEKNSNGRPFGLDGGRWTAALSGLTVDGVALLLLIFLIGCYENQEGCLDLRATNFDLDADIACENCCSYPKLQVSFLHQFKDNSQDTFYNFALHTPYTFSSLDTFQVEDIRFYLSDFKLRLEDGSFIGVEEKIEISVPTDAGISEVEDNVVLVNRSRPTTNTIGTIREEYQCKGIQFKFGLKDSVNLADPTFFETSHPLYSALDGDLYAEQDSSYVFNHLELIRKETDTLTISMTKKEYVQTIDIDKTFSSKKGANTTLVLRIDYREWLKDIDFLNDDIAIMAEKIKAGIGNSFELIEVRN